MAGKAGMNKVFRDTRGGKDPEAELLRLGQCSALLACSLSLYNSMNDTCLGSAPPPSQNLSATQGLVQS